MPGPPPKDRDQRARRNKPAGGDWVVLPSEGRTGRAPKLEAEVSDETKKWWRRIWKSPMATQWTPADIEALTELAILRDIFVHEGVRSLAQEVRLRSDLFGLTPRGRQQLRWVVDDEVRVADVAPTAPDDLEKRRSARKARVMERLGSGGR